MISRANQAGDISPAVTGVGGGVGDRDYNSNNNDNNDDDDGLLSLLHLLPLCAAVWLVY